MFDWLRRPIEAHNKIWLGGIALAVVAIAVAGILVIGRLPLGLSQYQGEFAQAAQIRPGDRVTVAGIPVGKVGSLTLAGDRVIVDFNVRNDVHLGADTRAAIKLTTLLGSRYLELSPSGPGGLDHAIPLANTSVPYDLQQALANATSTFEQVDADRIAESLAVSARSLSGVPDALPAALANLKALSGIMATRRDQLGSLLRSADTVTAMVRNQKADLGSLVLQGRQLLGDLVSRRAALEQLFTSVTALVNRIKAILGDAPAITQMLTSIGDFNRMIAEHDALLRDTLQTMPIFVRNFANISGSAASIDVTVPAGPMIDSWMCAISGRADQFGLPAYFQDCK